MPWNLDPSGMKPGKTGTEFNDKSGADKQKLAERFPDKAIHDAALIAVENAKSLKLIADQEYLEEEEKIMSTVDAHQLESPEYALHLNQKLLKNYEARKRDYKEVDDGLNMIHGQLDAKQLETTIGPKKLLTFERPEAGKTEQNQGQQQSQDERSPPTAPIEKSANVKAFQKAAEIAI